MNARCWLTGAALSLLHTGGAEAAAARPANTLHDLSRRQVEIRIDAPAVRDPVRAMDNYRRFLELQNADPARRAEAMRRLGDLSLEGGELERLASEVGRVDLGAAEAIKLYTALLEAYPDYSRNDQVLYQLARAYETTGQSVEALQRLDEIVRRYPGSSELAEVHFRRGETHFSAQRYRDAEAAYAAVVALGPQAAFHQQSLYKQGWSLFKLGLGEEALPVFARVLDRKLLDPRQAGALRALPNLARADRELVDDTLRVMSITLADQEGGTSLDALVTRLADPPYADLLYARLGELYMQKQRYQDAASTFAAFGVRSPRHEQAPILASRAIAAYREGGFTQRVLEAKQGFVERYNFEAPFWQGRERKQYPAVVAELKGHLDDVAAWYHSVAQKSRRDADYAQAIRWYELQLTQFADDAGASRTRFLLAEAFYETRRYADAVEQFERSAYDRPGNPDAARAAYAALDAYAKAEPLVPEPGRAAWRLRATEAGVRFAQSFPQHEDAEGVLTRAIESLYAAGSGPRAVEVAALLLARTPPALPARQRIAQGVTGQVRFEAGEFAAAEQAWVAARSLADAGSGEAVDLEERVALAVYRQAEAARDGGDASAAAAQFLRVAQAAPASKIRLTSQYDAAAVLLAAAQWQQAIPVLEAFRAQAPGHELQPEVTQKLAVAYAAAGRPAEASLEYERIAAREQETPAVREEALSLAADLAEKGGDSRRTAVLLERLVKSYPENVALRIETRQRLADLAQARNDAAGLLAWRKAIVQADATAGAARTDRTRFLAARARLQLALPARDAFRALPLRNPLNKSLVAKRKGLDAALAEFKAAAAYEVAEVTTQASFEIAELYRQLARDLLASERPPRLGPDEREQYDLLLEEQAIPFEEQAIKLHEANLQLARDGLYDAGVQASQAALEALVPGRYQLSETRGRTRDTEAVLLAQAQEQADKAAPLYNLSLLQRAAGRTDEAELSLRQALLREPESPLLWTELGLQLREQGRLDEAAASYNEALTREPGNVAALRNAAVLEAQFRNDPVAAAGLLGRLRAVQPDDLAVMSWHLRQVARATPAGDPPS
jgi:tetratricopeptide (TPR) repeat protein